MESYKYPIKMDTNLSTNTGIQTTTPSLSENIWSGLKSNLQPLQGSTIAQDTIGKTMRGIMSNETRGVQNPYGSSQPSNTPGLGNALGAYRITEADLARLSPKYLNKVVNPREFLANPDLQNTFMKNRITYQLSQGYSPEQIADIHRSGTGNILPPDQYKFQHPEYVQTFKQVK